MAAAFCGFMVGPVTGLRQFGLALALGVLLDATLVRGVLVPALMTVLRPTKLVAAGAVARVLRVEPSPLRTREA